MTFSPPPVRAVVFDLDGTLLDTMPHVLAAFAHALKPFRPDLDEAAIFRRLGGPPVRMMEELTGSKARATEAMKRLDDFGFGGGGSVRAFEGMSAMLTRLCQRGVALAIWTGRDRLTTQRLLDEHGLAALFNVTVCGDDLPTHKPDPEGMGEILRRLGVAPECVVYAGDADADVLGGVAAGVRTILISHGRVPPPEIVARAWQVVDTPGQAYASIIRATAMH